MSNRRFFFLSDSEIIKEFPFEKGRTSSIKVWLDTKAFDYIGIQPYDFDNNVMLDINGGSVKTYKTIIINDYECMSENLCVYYADRMGTNLSWLNFDQNIIDSMNQSYQSKHNVSVDRFYLINGSYFSSYPTTLSFRTSYKVYSDLGEQIEGWGLPYLEDIQTLVGYAPCKDGNIALAVRNFLYANSDFVGSDYTGNWFTNNNISGLCLTPLGRRHSGESGLNGQTYFAYKEECSLRTAESFESQVVFNTRGIDYYSKLYHLGQARYFRRLSSSELGYKFYYDYASNQVLCLPHNEKVSLKEVEYGYLRGIIYRYFDRENKKVLMSLSSLQTMVNSLYSSFITIY